MPSLRRAAARALDVLAVAIVLAAIVRFAVVPRLHNEVTQAPTVTLATLDGGRYDLARRRGHLVFLDFWASWCDPCRQSIPLVQHFRRTHPGVDVVSVDVGEPEALVRPFVARYRMGQVALDPDAIVAHAFGVTGYPTLVAVDRSGRIRAKWVGFDPDVERVMAAEEGRLVSVR
ncbi:MAG: TlpA family protein disulfide reductase [Candidatus Eremiobacteraeota bacterium]|nr:TlpA family protein disulfide reductase [Candidatus Eremiobacteraeota bacterium]